MVSNRIHKICNSSVLRPTPVLSKIIISASDIGKRFFWAENSHNSIAPCNCLVLSRHVNLASEKNSGRCAKNCRLRA